MTPASVHALAAAIVNRAGQPTSRFDVVLQPAGLGRVDVRLQIGADGRLSARMTFEKSQSASAFGARSGELRNALAQAGFEVGADALSFDANGAMASGSGSGAGAGAGGQGAQQGDPEASAAAARSAARAAAFAASEFDALPNASVYGGAAASGLDIRI